VRNVDDETYLFVAKEGVAVRRVVSTGGQAGDRIVVSSGLSEGEQVIVSAISSLSDQTPVTPTVLAAGR
jgi:multidrug efflux pump subunit AcrA (membrane-fusion protein)